MEQQDSSRLKQILKNRRDKLAEYVDAGMDPFKITKFDRDNDSKNIKDNYDKYADKEVTIAGRLMSKRRMGKIGFGDLSDFTGKIQVFARKDVLGDEEYDRFKKLDIGDIIGVTGIVFTTEAGEISVRAEKITLLSKSLLPLPEKFHGLSDPDLRYRQRYVDLIMNEGREGYICKEIEDRRLQ